MRRVAVPLLLFALAACGRKGEPLPPIVEVPETTTDLAAVQVEREVVLTWSYPQLTRAGRTLTDLGRVEVWRLEVPPGQEQTTVGPTGEEIRRQLMLNRGRLLVRLEGKGLADATRGSKLTFTDPLGEVGTGTTPSYLWYAVRSRRRDGTPSALSNIVTVRPRPVPPAVTGLTAEPKAKGIELGWQDVAGAAYLVERQNAAGGGWSDPVGHALPATSWLDGGATQGATWRYRVRAVVNDVRGPTSAPVEVAYPDVYAPPAVTGLICLPEIATVRLRWDPSPEAGVRYKVFRRVADGGWEHLEDEGTTPEFTDTNPGAGETTYAVRVFDAAGNHAEAVMCTVRAGR